MNMRELINALLDQNLSADVEVRIETADGGSVGTYRVRAQNKGNGTVLVIDPDENMMIDTEEMF